MATRNKRVGVTLDQETASILSLLAIQDPSHSVSHVAKQLILEALEIREDAYLLKLVKEREGQKKVSHAKAWK